MFTLVAHARVQHSLETKAASTLGVCARLPEHSTCWTLRQRPLLLPVYVAWVYYTLDTKAALPLVARARLPGYTTCWTLRQRPLLLPVYVARVFYTLDTKAALPLVACARLSEYSTLMWTHPTVRIRTRCRCPIAWSRRCSGHLSGHRVPVCGRFLIVTSQSTALHTHYSVTLLPVAPKFWNGVWQGEID